MEKIVQGVGDVAIGAASDAAVLARLVGSLRELKQQIHAVMVGQEPVIDSVLCCMLAGGHCIVQGVPGLAKTLLVHSVAEALDMSFNRVQFTPDLMPSDITGTDIIQESSETRQRSYEFVKGPIFANMILADEINRTPPKTQSALLQAMQEREVTVSGRTYKLERPFFVQATQNPIEQEGTYPLPEAALDRFMFMIYIDYPNAADELQIVKRTTTGRAVALKRVLSREEMLQFQDVVKRAPVSDAVMEYCVRLARASRPGEAGASAMVKKYLKWGAGPRASQYMTLGAKALALMDGRITPSYQDVKQVCPLVLRHRIVPNFEAEADGVSVESIVADILQHTPVPK